MVKKQLESEKLCREMLSRSACVEIPGQVYRMQGAQTSQARNYTSPTQ